MLRRLRLGKLLAKEGRPHEAIAVLDQAHRLNPRSPTPLVERARCYEAVDLLDDAIRDMEEALRLVPEARRFRLVLEGLQQKSAGSRQL